MPSSGSMVKRGSPYLRWAIIWAAPDNEIEVKDADVVYITYTDHLPYIANIEW